MVVIKESKTFYFYSNWPKSVDENLKHETAFIIKSNESFAQNKIETEIEQLLFKYQHGNNIQEHRKQQTEEPHKFVLNLSQRLDVTFNSHVALQNVYTYYTWKNIRKSVLIIN